MVRFALLIGASVLLALFLLNTAHLTRKEPADLPFEREVVTMATSTVTATSSTEITDSASLPITTQLPKVSEEVSTSTHKKEEQKKLLSATTTTLLPQSAPKATRPPSLSPEVLNEKARSALVNILCEASAPLKSTSGSGVFIDSRGIILTNAHIAQYFLLENSPYPVSCTVRTGSPAVAKWHAKLIFIPETWVGKHAKDILSSRATGTGEHDYALLVPTDSVDGDPLPTSFPFVRMNYEEAASVTSDPVLIAGYPAEFVGGSAARSSLHASTVFSNVKQLLTFTEGIVDVISVGGTVLAQSGSSGGSFVDLYGSLVGLIVTTTTGDTTGTRDLHAITPAHIDRSMRQHLGASTQTFLSREPNTLLSSFESMGVELSRVLQKALELQRD